MSHAKPRLSSWSRLLLVERVLAGRPAAHVAAEMGVSRATAYKWLGRYRLEGVAGLSDRSSRPHHSPARTDALVEAQIVALRRDRRLGPARIASILGMAPSTVHRVLVRHQMARLSWLDRPTGQVIRRYERARPGELVHVDVKKIGRLRVGGGWRVHGRDSLERRRARAATRVGYEFVHAAIDDHTRLAYSEVLADEKDHTCAAFLHRALAWFASQGVRVHRVLTDNAMVYRHGGDWGWVCTAWQLKRRFTKTGCPWTNGKAERFNRTLLAEWAYARAWTSNRGRTRALDTFLRFYNTRRGHSALGGRPPITRLAA